MPDSITQGHDFNLTPLRDVGDPGTIRRKTPAAVAEEIRHVRKLGQFRSLAFERIE